MYLSCLRLRTYIDYTRLLRLQPLRLQIRLQQNAKENEQLVISITVIFDYSITVISVTQSQELDYKVIKQASITTFLGQGHTTC